MALDMTRFLARFVDEARDHISKLNEGLVQLENHPEDAETINAVFRSAHTIKGSSRMMKLTAITEVAHKLEEALGALREKKIGHSRGLADILFKGIDCIAGMVDKVSAGAPLDEDTSALCDELAGAAEGRFATVDAAAKEPSPPETAPQVPLEEMKGQTAAAAETAGPEAAHRIEPIDAHPPDDCPETAVPEKKTGASESIRVNADKLDELIRLMGEIVSHQNRLKQRLSDIREAEKAAKRNVDISARFQQGNDSCGEFGEEIVRCAQALQVKLKQLSVSMRDDANMQELLTSDLQEKALMLRMVPLSTVFDSLPRMVRDMSRSLGKDVVFMIEGGEIGLDKKMIEKIGDPLVHMLRNAVDHGVESPEERRKTGKPEKGTIRIAASYDAGSVVIELSDDGGGIPLGKLREKALKKNLFSEADLDSLTDEETIDLIFLPGFSTSPIITDISGRGVGMDVVKKNIVEGLKGSIKIETKQGKGTRFLMRLPLTLAVMRVLLVEAAGTVFAITAHYVTEIIRVPETEIIHVLNRKAIRLREELIPVAHLETILKLSVKGPARSTNLLMLIVRLGNEKLGLIVDALLDEEDMVIKSLPAHMKNIQLVSGVTISGRNEVLNILHVPGIIKEAGEMREARLPEKARNDAAQILVVDDSVNTREIEKSILEAYGYAVDLAEDGMEAVEKTREKQYDLIITDVEMPRLDGFSLTERLRKEHTYNDTPIIIMTSREKEEDKKRGILVGANAYIIKGSFDQTNLLETVQNLIG
ncbi:MAG: hybrid sensor histidine kinase/response regulator [Desulfobacteraceae bacterium]|nr:MAG: hybrid sensor histidine kinase/response regulator [Desulfobacteraceae bacterium]